MGKWILALLALPPIDLLLLFRLRHVVGGSAILLAVLFSALLGAVIARAVGLRQLREWQDALTQGRTPSHNVIEGLLLLLGCVWLIVPGVLSDVLGLLLLVRPIRRWLSERALERVRQAVEQGAMSFTVRQPQAGFWPPGGGIGESPGYGDVIDVEGEVVEEKTADKRLPSSRKPGAAQ